MSGRPSGRNPSPEGRSGTDATTSVRPERSTVITRPAKTSESHSFPPCHRGPSGKTRSPRSTEGVSVSIGFPPPPSPPGDQSAARSIEHLRFLQAGDLLFAVAEKLAHHAVRVLSQKRGGASHPVRAVGQTPR